MTEQILNGSIVYTKYKSICIKYKYYILILMYILINYMQMIFIHLACFNFFSPTKCPWKGKKYCLMPMVNIYAIEMPLYDIEMTMISEIINILDH